MKKIAILGSTGSIGTQTLEVVAEHKDIEVVALACAGFIHTGLYGHGRITCSSNDSRSRNSCDCNCWNVRNTSDNCSN